MKMLFVAFGLLVSGLSAVSSVSAHGESPSLEAEVGDYLIDIGYEELAANEDVSFDVDLFRVGPPIDYASFASVDVRVTQDGAELLATSIENDDLHVPTFTANFPSPGGYDIDVRFLDAQNALIVARTFHVEVPTPTGVFMSRGLNGLHYVLAGILFALSAGIAGYSLWERFVAKKK